MMKASKITGRGRIEKVSIAKPAKPDPIPSGKRAMAKARNLAKVEDAIRNQGFVPSFANIRKLCKCGDPAATAIRAELIKRGLAEADSSGRMSTA